MLFYAIEWAKEKSTGTFYCTDGLDLSWIPDNYFHHFFSFATANYVPTEKWENFCNETIRIIKPEGTIAFGWLDSKYGRPYGRLPKTRFDFLKNIKGIKYKIIDENILYSMSKCRILSNCESYTVFIKKIS